MKKIAIMQPYFFPYIGYFQLINAVDLFVVYDDGSMIKRGFMSANSLLSSDHRSPLPIRLRVSHGNYLKPIKDVEVADNSFNFEKLLKTIHHNYSGAPYYDDVYPVLERCLRCPERNLTRLLVFMLRQVCDYIGITTPFAFSSEAPKDGAPDAQRKIFRTCDHFGIHHYINPIGGTKYYDKAVFAANGVKLSFLRRSDDICYKQFKGPFVKDLSIIDVMMFNSPEQIRSLLQQFSLE